MKSHSDPEKRARSKTLVLTSGAVLACLLVVVGAWAFAAAGDRPTASSSRPYWLVLGSDRDGDRQRAYEVRQDGSRLTRLFGDESSLDPIQVSADGRLIAYQSGLISSAVYVSRADGTGVTRVARWGTNSSLSSASLSPDGSEIAITLRVGLNEHPRLFVVDTHSGERRDLGRAADADWSPDGRQLVFATPRGCGVAVEPFTDEPAHVRELCGVPKWSPDGRSIVFETRGGCAVVGAPPLASWVRGSARGLLESERLLELKGKCETPDWSPDSRWIAFGASGCPFCDSEKAMRAARKKVGVWVVRPNGEDRRRVGPGDEESEALYSWSPDSTRLAIMAGSKIVVADLAGRPRRLHLGISAYSEVPPLWSPDGKRLLLTAQAGDDPAQIWSFRSDGGGMRRLTNEGTNEFVGTAALAPVRPPAEAIPGDEHVHGSSLLATDRPIGLLSADGASVAYTVGSTETDCEHISTWTPGTVSTRRVWPRLPAPCSDDDYSSNSVYELALAGSVVGWSYTLGCGNTGCGVWFQTTTLPKADPRLVDEDDGSDYGNEFLRPFSPVGRGSVFVGESAVRVALPGGNVRRCNLKDEADSVDGHLIAARRSTDVAILDDRCSLVNVIPFPKGEVKAVLLDGRRLVVARTRLVEAYDVTSGALVVRREVPAGYALEGASGGLVLLRNRKRVFVLRLDDGRTVRFTPCHGPVHAALDRRGLYYAYRTIERHGRLAFVPRAELDRRLASGANDESACVRSFVTYRKSAGSSALAVGDLNGDHRPDLVTANEKAGVSVLLTGSRGTLRGWRDYRTGGSPVSVAIGDLNGDRHPDLATANLMANSVSVLLNNGDGSFAAARRYPVGKEAVAAAIGDLDGDGNRDLVAANGEAGTVSVLLNTGAGTFSAKIDYPAGDSPSSVRVRDVDGNGTLDVVVGHIGSFISVFPGKGDGSFGRRRRLPVVDLSDPIAVADLNGNGRPDIVAVHDCGVLVLLDRGHGAFKRARESHGSEDCPRALAVGDLDGDRKPDLVTAGDAYPYPNTVSVLLNRGGGRFEAGGLYELGANGNSGGALAIADLNGDGRPDLATSSSDAGSVSVLTNTLGVCRVRGFKAKTPVAAKRTLARAGCHIAKVSRAYSTRVAKGRVIAAEPRFGAFWPNGPEVDLVVSKGARLAR